MAAYCTVNCTVAVWFMEPEVAVIVTVLVPDGVPGTVVVPPPPPPPEPLELPPPPQPSRIPQKSATVRIAQPRLNRPTGSRKASRPLRSTRPARCIDVVAAVVAIVTVVVAAPDPGVTVAGAKVQVDLEGRPLQAKVTACENPPAGVTVTVAVPDWPAVTESVVGLAPMVNDGGTAACTVTVTALEVEAAKLVSPP